MELYIGSAPLRRCIRYDGRGSGHVDPLESVLDLSAGSRGARWLCFIPIRIARGPQHPSRPVASPSTASGTYSRLARFLRAIQYGLCAQSGQRTRCSARAQARDKACSAPSDPTAPGASYLDETLKRLARPTITSPVFCAARLCPALFAKSVNATVHAHSTMRSGKCSPIATARGSAILATAAILSGDWYRWKLCTGIKPGWVKQGSFGVTRRRLARGYSLKSGGKDYDLMDWITCLGCGMAATPRPLMTYTCSNISLSIARRSRPSSSVERRGIGRFRCTVPRVVAGDFFIFLTIPQWLL